MPRSSGGTEETGRYPRGVGSPRGPPEGPQVSDPGSVGPQVADVAGLPGRGGCTPHHGRGRQQLAPPGLAQRPCPLALPLAQPAAATAPAPTQAAAQLTAHTADARKWGGELGPLTHGPPRYGVTEERAPPPAAGRGVTTSAGENLLPRSPLTADRQPSRPPPAGRGDKGPQRGPARGSGSR